LDSTNFHLRIARPGLVGQAVQYERTKFGEQLAKGDIILTRTTEWLEEVAGKILEERGSSRTDPPLHGIDVWRHAFADFLLSQTEVPETLSLDQDRLDDLRRELTEVLLLAAILLVSKTFSAGSTARNINWSILASRLKVLQSESPENIVAEIVQFISSPQLKRDTLLSVVRRIKTGSDPCVMLLQRRIKTVIMNSLVGGEISVTGMGFGEVEKEVKDVVQRIGKVGKVNWACYREWYEGIVGSYLERNLSRE